MSEEVELKPCPYCEKAIKLVEVVGYFYANCPTANCPASPIKQGGFDRNREEVIRMWNTRPGEQAAYEAGRAAGKRAERERIVGALEAVEARYRDDEKRADWVEEQVRCARAANHFLHAIAIAREEGGG